MNGIVTVLAAALAALLIGYAAIRVSGRLGLVSGTNTITRETRRRVPLVGGVVMWIAGVASLAAVRPAGWADGCVALLALLPFLVVGAIDDARPMRPGPKFALQALCAVPVVLAAGAPHLTKVAGANWALSVLCLLVLVNAFNFIDVADGVAGSVALVALLALAAIEPAAGPVCLALAGGAAGFLWHNKPAARMFMGDAGSHLIGAACGLAALRYAGHVGATEGATVALLVLYVPVFDLVFTMWVRAAAGRPVYMGSPDHVPLRLRRWGLVPWAVMCAMGAAAALAAGTGVLVAGSGGSARFWAAAAGLAAAVVVGAALRRLDLPAPQRAGGA